jgi:hypothetical protein
MAVIDSMAKPAAFRPPPRAVVYPTPGVDLPNLVGNGAIEAGPDAAAQPPTRC